MTGDRAVFNLIFETVRASFIANRISFCSAPFRVDLREIKSFGESIRDRIPRVDPRWESFHLISRRQAGY